MFTGGGVSLPFLRSTQVSRRSLQLYGWSQRKPAYEVCVSANSSVSLFSYRMYIGDISCHAEQLT